MGIYFASMQDAQNNSNIEGHTVTVLRSDLFFLMSVIATHFEWKLRRT